MFLFLLLFACLFKKKHLRVWCYHGEGRKGCSSSLLHAVGWTGKLVEEQIGVAGAYLAGGRGCDTGSIESVSFTCHWTPAIGCVIIVHGGSGVTVHKL